MSEIHDTTSTSIDADSRTPAELTARNHGAEAALANAMSIAEGLQHRVSAARAAVDAAPGNTALAERGRELAGELAAALSGLTDAECAANAASLDARHLHGAAAYAAARTRDPLPWDVFGAAMPIRERVLAAAAAGIPVLFIGAGKMPLDLRSPAQMRADDTAAADAAKAANNPRWASVRGLKGVHLATTDATRLNAYLDAFGRSFGPSRTPNLGMRLMGRTLVVVDADNAEGVAAFRQYFAEHTGTDFAVSTVMSPGRYDPATHEWVHRGGGHLYLTLPEGVDLSSGPAACTVDPHPELGENGQPSVHSWTVMVHSKYVLVPPSQRAEGRYIWTGEVHPIPTELLADLQGRVATAAAGAVARAERVRSGEATAVDRWAAAVTWESLLLEDGWGTTPSVESCGCPIFTAPGPHGSPKSATAHEAGCSEMDTSLGHGPLHIWTDNPPAGIAAYTASTGSTTLTKLQYTAWTHFDGDLGAVCAQIDGAAMVMRDASGVPLVANGTFITTAPAMLPLPVDGDDGDGDAAVETPVTVADDAADVPTDDPAAKGAPIPHGVWAGAGAERRAEMVEDWRILVEEEGFDPHDRELYPEGHHSSPQLLREIMNFSDRTRAVFHAARGGRSVHPVGLLLLSLARTGMAAPVTLGPFEGTALSTYVAHVGKSGSGKGQTSRAHYLPWRELRQNIRYAGEGWIPPDLDADFELGSGQVLVDLLMDEVDDESVPDDPKAKKLVMKGHPMVHLAIDEIASFLALMGGANSTLATNLTSAWSGKRLGTASRKAGTEKRTSGPYSIFVTGGLQPAKSQPLLDSSSVGLVQRFIWAGVEDPYRFVGSPAIARPGAVTPPPDVVIPQDGGFRLCATVMREQRRAEIKSAGGGAHDADGDLESHALMVRIRLACLFALWHGGLDVTDEVWRWSGAVMEYSRRSRLYSSAVLAAVVQGDENVVEARRNTARTNAVAALDDRRVELAKTLIRRLQKSPEALTESVLLQALSGRPRRGGMSDRKMHGAEALNRALQQPGVQRQADGKLRWVGGQQ